MTYCNSRRMISAMTRPIRIEFENACYHRQRERAAGEALWERVCRVLQRAEGDEEIRWPRRIGRQTETGWRPGPAGARQTHPDLDPGAPWGPADDGGCARLRLTGRQQRAPGRSARRDRGKEGAPTRQTSTTPDTGRECAKCQELSPSAPPNQALVGGIPSLTGPDPGAILSRVGSGTVCGRQNTVPKGLNGWLRW